MLRNPFHRILILTGTIALLTGCQSPQPSPTAAYTQPPGQATPAATLGLNTAAIPSTSTHTAPTLIPSITPLPSLTPLPTLAPSGSLSLPGVHVAALAINQDAVFWVSKTEPGIIYKKVLSAEAAVSPEQLVKSRFITGNMAAMPLQVHGDWLVFMDQAFNATNPVWRLRAYNLATKEDRLLDQAGGDWLANIYSFSADENQVAWIVQDHEPKRSCIEESTLHLADLATKRSTEIVRSCATSDKQWNSVQVAHGRILASVTLISEKNKTQVDLWETASATPRSLSAAYPADTPSYPALGSDWAAWQNGVGQTRFTRLAGGTSALLTSPLDGDPLAGPLITQEWITWLPTPDLLAYNLEKSTWQVIAAPAPGETIGQVATGSGWIAWSREITSGSTTSSRIEWAALR